MSITQIDIHILNDDRKGFSHLKTVHPGQLVNTDALLERLAHTDAAQELNRRFPDQWCYHSFLLGERVTDMALVPDGGFDGQFQWKQGEVFALVPAIVDTQTVPPTNPPVSEIEAFFEDDARENAAATE